MIGIICDTGSNLPELILKRYQIRRVPLRIILGKTEYRDDGVEITEDQLLNYMQTSMPKTTLPSYDDIHGCFEEMIGEGYDEILVINLASVLSGTYNSFNLVSKKVMKEYPHVKVTVLDSQTVSMGVGLLLYKAGSMIVENPSISMEKLVETIKQTMSNQRVFFVVPTLKFLVAGGRIGRVLGTIGELLKVKPILTVAEDGSLHQLGKEMGLTKAVNHSIQFTKDFIGTRQVEAIAVYHSGKSEETLSHVERVLKEFETYHIPEIFTGTISSTLLVHGGPGLVGIGIQLK